MKLEKQPPRPRAVRSTPSSRNSPWLGVLSPLLFVYDQGCAVLRGPLFTIAKVLSALPPTNWRCPVASSPTHLKTLMVEVEPPWVKSLTSRMSPSACLPRTGPVPLPLTFGLSVMLFRKNQNPAVASPLLS